jgi:hypothetical protein
VVGGAPGSVLHLALEDALTAHRAHVPPAGHTSRPLTPRSRGPPGLS